MDFDGLLALMDRDHERFEEWMKGYDRLTLKELRDNYQNWLGRYLDAKKKYMNLKPENEAREITFFAGKLTYFYILANYTLVSLTIYSSKLEKEHPKFKSKKGTKPRQNKKRAGVF
ncbi:MAG: hypothetical protein AB1608_02275 [Thermoproteota archaeon]